jgi:tetratricopeptide (TPR) repeat protein
MGPVKHRKRRPNTSRLPVEGAPSAKPAAAVGAPTLTLRRKWLFRLAASVLFPLLLMGTLEGVLRIAGYGYPTRFFLKTRISGEDVYVENARFGLRFFPPAMSRRPAPVVMQATKPANTYRIFLFGESAALGDPAPAYGMGRYLKVLLEERFPARHFEVVCVAMTAINSHAILPIARECAWHQGDLWVIYMGNNEMIGPFGANTVFGPQAPSWRLVRASLALKKTRIGQALAALNPRARGEKSALAAWGGLKMFAPLPPEDRRREVVDANFRKNLEDIMRIGLDSGVRIIASTVASNLKDCSPFASVHTARLSDADKARWDGLFTRALSAQSDGSFQQALTLSQEAARLDSRFAELAFRQGECWMALTNSNRARPCFERARDSDALPFRADSTLNAIIAETVRNRGGSRVQLLDAVEVLAQQCPEGIPGQESFYEHVHLTFDGNYRLARAFADAVARLASGAWTAGAQPDWATRELCERRLGLTDWNRYAICERVLQRISEAPFTNQLTHIRERQRLLKRLSDWRSGLKPQFRANALSVYQEAIERAPSDSRLHENFAEFLEATGDLAAAAAQWQIVRQLLPQHYVAYFQVGRLLARLGKDTKAADSLGRALVLEPRSAEARIELSQLLAKEGKLDLALAQLTLAAREQPENAQLHQLLADVLTRQGNHAGAIEELRKAVQLKPTFFEARYLLGVELALADRIPEAQSEFEEVLRLRPSHILARLNLGVTLARQGKAADARRQFEEVLRLDPQNQKARQELKNLEATPRR